MAFAEDWQVKVMEEAWRAEAITSAQAYKVVTAFGAKVSRTSVIYFLNRMVAETILLAEPITSEGHLQFLYRPNGLIIHEADKTYPLPPSREAFKRWLQGQLLYALTEVPESG